MIKNISQLEALISSTHKVMSIVSDKNFHSASANVTSSVIAIHESGNLKYRVQNDGDNDKYDGGLGIHQMERSTFDTVVKYSEHYPVVAKALGLENCKFEDLEHSDFLSIVFCRLRLSMDENPLPKPHNREEVAKYCKSFWNTKDGKATWEKYYNDYCIAKGL